MTPAHSGRIPFSHVSIRQRTNWINSPWCFCLIKAFLFISKPSVWTNWLDQLINYISGWCVSVYSLRGGECKGRLSMGCLMSNVKYNLSQLSPRYLHPKCSQMHAKDARNKKIQLHTPGHVHSVCKYSKALDFCLHKEDPLSLTYFVLDWIFGISECLFVVAVV